MSVINGDILSGCRQKKNHEKNYKIYKFIKKPLITWREGQNFKSQRNKISF